MLVYIVYVLEIKYLLLCTVQVLGALIQLNEF